MREAVRQRVKAIDAYLERVLVHENAERKREAIELMLLPAMGGILMHMSITMSLAYYSVREQIFINSALVSGIVGAFCLFHGFMKIIKRLEKGRKNGW